MEMVPIGWDCYNAVVGPYSGRLLVNSGGLSGLLWNDTPSSPGWGRTQINTTACERYVRAAMQWLSGKATGQSVIFFYSGATTNVWGGYFQDFLTRSGTANNIYAGSGAGPWNGGIGLGGTLTLVPSSSPISWTNTNWDGYNPFNYDVVLLEAESTFYNDEIDNYLANYGAIWSLQAIFGTLVLGRYGLTWPKTGTPQTLSPDYLLVDYAIPPFGSGTFQYASYGTTTIGLGTNTMGGGALTYGGSTFLWAS